MNPVLVFEVEGVTIEAIGGLAAPAAPDAMGKHAMPRHVGGIALAVISSLGFLANATAGPCAAPTGSVATDTPSNAAATQTASVQAVETASYQIGLLFGSQLASSGLGSTVSREQLLRGIDEALAGRIPSAAQKESAQQFIRAARTTLAARNAEQARLFLEKNAHESGIETLPRVCSIAC